MRAPLALATVAALSLGVAASVQAQTAPGGECPEEPAGVVERLASAVGDVLGAANPPARRFRAGLTNCPPGTGFRPLSSVHGTSGQPAAGSRKFLGGRPALMMENHRCRFPRSDCNGLFVADLAHIIRGHSYEILPRKQV